MAITTKKTADRIAQLEAKLKQEKAALRAAEARQRAVLSKKARADDTRRKILLGAIILKRAENPSFKQIFDRLLDEELTRDDDRALFGLSPRASGGGTEGQPVASG